MLPVINGKELIAFLKTLGFFGHPAERISCPVEVRRRAVHHSPSS